MLNEVIFHVLQPGIDCSGDTEMPSQENNDIPQLKVSTRPVHGANVNKVVVGAS